MQQQDADNKQAEFQQLLTLLHSSEQAAGRLGYSDLAANRKHWHLRLLQQQSHQHQQDNIQQQAVSVCAANGCQHTASLAQPQAAFTLQSPLAVSGRPSHSCLGAGVEGDSLRQQQVSLQLNSNVQQEQEQEQEEQPQQQEVQEKQQQVCQAKRDKERPAQHKVLYSLAGEPQEHSADTLQADTFVAAQHEIEVVRDIAGRSYRHHHQQQQPSTGQLLLSSSQQTQCSLLDALAVAAAVVSENPSAIDHLPGLVPTHMPMSWRTATTSQAAAAAADTGGGSMEGSGVTAAAAAAAAAEATAAAAAAAAHAIECLQHAAGLSGAAAAAAAANQHAGTVAGAGFVSAAATARGTTTLAAVRTRPPQVSPTGGVNETSSSNTATASPSPDPVGTDTPNTAAVEARGVSSLLQQPQQQPQQPQQHKSSLLALADELGSAAVATAQAAVEAGQPLSYEEVMQLMQPLEERVRDGLGAPLQEVPGVGLQDVRRVSVWWVLKGPGWSLECCGRKSWGCALCRWVVTGP